LPTLHRAAPPPQTAALRDAQILVAEDDPVSQLLARELLSRHGALVTLVTTGTEAVAAAAEGDFDLLLMDVRMPEMDGLTACRQIRALPNGKLPIKLPIIALTANALAGERERCLAAGMDGYLTKPLEPESLYAELSRWLRLPAAAHEVSQPESVIAGRDITQPVSVIASRPIDLSGFDATKVRRWLDEAPDIWRTMAQRLVAEYPETASAIAGALDADDRARAGDLLHRLRGAAGALGADDLSAAAEQLELALASDEPVDADLRVRFFASAEVSNAALTELKILD
jgi:CheY-like chemotaxis protein